MKEIKNESLISISSGNVVTTSVHTIHTDEITSSTTMWKGGYVTDNFRSYYLDENMVKHYD